MNNKDIDDILVLLKDFCNERESEYSDCLSLLDDFVRKYEASPNKNPFDYNYFVEYDIPEPQTSWVLGRMLQYTKNGEPVILKNFLQRLLASKTDFDISWIREPNVTIEEGHFDILIKDKQYAVIVENKLKGAPFQRNQLGRYIQMAKEQDYNEHQIYVIILPPKDYAQTIESTWKCPEDYRQGPSKVKCRSKVDAYKCWCDEDHSHCRECTDYRETVVCEKNSVMPTKELSQWLKELLSDSVTIPQKEILLRASMTLFADFLDSIYKNRDNDKLREEMIDFLRTRLIDKSKTTAENISILGEKIDAVEKLREYMDELYDSLNVDLVEEWRSSLMDAWGDYIIKDEENHGFYIIAKTLQIGCWFDVDTDDDKPYWCIRSVNESDPTSTQIKTATALCNAARIKSSDTDFRSYGWIYWQFTNEGNKVCDDLFKVAKELGYIKC